MGATPFIAVLALAFVFLLGLRIAILLILRRDELAPRNTNSPRWPDATVIKTDTPPNE